MRASWRGFFQFIVFSVFLTIVAVAATNVWVVRSTRQRIFNAADSLPRYRSALVLGTSSRLTNGKPNPFFVNRMEKAAQLYRTGKVSAFILSGDNRTRYYDEPGTMRDVLVDKGIPPSVVRLDAGGLRTFDSMERCKYVFGQDSVIIVTQPFHAYRALFLAEHLGMTAVVFAAREPNESVGLQVYFREILARTRAAVDVVALHIGTEDDES